jgi:hypothetical protein
MATRKTVSRATERARGVISLEEDRALFGKAPKGSKPSRALVGTLAIRAGSKGTITIPGLLGLEQARLGKPEEADQTP